MIDEESMKAVLFAGSQARPRRHTSEDRHGRSAPTNAPWQTSLSRLIGLVVYLALYFAVIASLFRPGEWEGPGRWVLALLVTVYFALVYRRLIGWERESPGGLRASKPPTSIVGATMTQEQQRGTVPGPVSRHSLAAQEGLWSELLGSRGGRSDARPGRAGPL